VALSLVIQTSKGRVVVEKVLMFSIMTQLQFYAICTYYLYGMWRVSDSCRHLNDTADVHCMSEGCCHAFAHNFAKC